MIRTKTKTRPEKGDKTLGELVAETRNLQKVEQQLRDASEISIPGFQGI